MIDAKRLRSLLDRASGRPWDYEHTHGMQLASFRIPGHWGKASVELLVADAALIVEAINALPKLLDVFDASTKFMDAHVKDLESKNFTELDMQIQIGKVFSAKEQLFDLLTLAERDDDDSDLGEDDLDEDFEV